MKYLIYFIVVAISFSCSSNKSYLGKMKDYRIKINKEFYDNEYLNLSKEEIHRISYFPVDPKYNCDCGFKVYTQQDTIIMSTYAGTEKKFLVYGEASCSIENTEFKLDVYKSFNPLTPKDYLFVPTKDLTSGEESYGGGRYIETKTTAIKNDSINLDFNKLYNPYCAYKDGFSCPIPPRKNHIDLAIYAGEKAFPRDDH